MEDDLISIETRQLITLYLSDDLRLNEVEKVHLRQAIERDLAALSHLVKLRHGIADPTHIADCIVQSIDNGACFNEQAAQSIQLPASENLGLRLALVRAKQNYLEKNPDTSLRLEDDWQYIKADLKVLTFSHFDAACDDNIEKLFQQLDHSLSELVGSY